jgi:hypothetical protein
MQITVRPLFIRLTPEEREAFDLCCRDLGVNYSIVGRAMVKHCLKAISKGKKLNLMAGMVKFDPSKS